MDRDPLLSQKVEAAVPEVNTYSCCKGMFPPSFIHSAAYHRWQNIGGQNQLYTDEEIACFLMNCYEESRSTASPVKPKCVTCSAPLTLSCPSCGQFQDIPSSFEGSNAEKATQGKAEPGKKPGVQRKIPLKEKHMQNVKSSDGKEFCLVDEPPSTAEHGHPCAHSPQRIFHSQSQSLHPPLSLTAPQGLCSQQSLLLQHSLSSNQNLHSQESLQSHQSLHCHGSLSHQCLSTDQSLHCQQSLQSNHLLAGHSQERFPTSQSLHSDQILALQNLSEQSVLQQNLPSQQNLSHQGLPYQQILSEQSQSQESLSQQKLPSQASIYSQEPRPHKSEKEDSKNAWDIGEDFLTQSEDVGLQQECGMTGSDSQASLESAEPPLVDVTEVTRADPSLVGAAKVTRADPSLVGAAKVTRADPAAEVSRDNQQLNSTQSVFLQQQESEKEEQDDQRTPSPSASSSVDSQEDRRGERHPEDNQDSPLKGSKTHHKGKKKAGQKPEFFCQPCNKKLSSRQAYERHVTSRLHAISLLPPEVQEKRRRRKKAVNPQQSNQDKSVYVVVQRAGRQDYQCKVCSEAFDTIPEVKQHRRQHKVREMCHLCGKTINVRGFRDHMLRHRGERQYSCSLCPKTFINAALLKEHAIVHTKEKPYCCEVCGACFRHRHTLKFHLRTHTGLKAYRCSQCDAAFTRPRGLSDHMRVHTGDKPYGCQVCGRCFSSSGNLAAHRRKVHKMAPILPSVPCRLLIT